jgi:tetratricopeptide (TPR) repeat protein
VATVLGNLANLYHSKGEYSAAESLYHKSLTIETASLGPNHPRVALGLENYAALLRKTGRAGEARELEARAAAIRAKTE